MNSSVEPDSRDSKSKAFDAVFKEFFPDFVPSESSLTVAKGESSWLLQTMNELPRPFAQEIFLLSCHVAGTSYRDLETVEPKLQIGEIFILRREPENKYDALAIAVLTSNETQLGYVPRKINEVLARLLDAGKLLQARLTAKEWKTGYSDKNWLRLDIKIFLRDF